jgi:hypothetical protein
MRNFKHLAENKESYLTHMHHAFHISYCMFTSSIKCLIHAFYPDIFIDSASSTCSEIIKYMENRKKITSE